MHILSILLQAIAWQQCVAFFIAIIVSLCNRTAQRWRWQNISVWQTRWLLLASFLMILISQFCVPLFYIKICLKEGKLWQKIYSDMVIIVCHTCRTGSAIFFPLPSFCVSSRMIHCTWRKLPYLLLAWIASHQHNCHSFYIFTMTVVSFTIEVFYH